MTSILLLFAVSACRTSDLVTAKQIRIERCTDSRQPPADCRFVPFGLTEAGERELRELIAAADQKQRDGGVWGFVSYSYRVTFVRSSGASEFLWLHVTRDAAWLDGQGRLGHIVFTRDESARLWEILTRHGH